MAGSGVFGLDYFLHGILVICLEYLREGKVE
jgi:hypothetical protein